MRNLINNHWSKILGAIAVVIIGVTAYGFYESNQEKNRLMSEQLEIQKKSQQAEQTKDEKIQELEAKLNQINESSNTPKPTPTPSTNTKPINSDLAIESCKAKAKQYADAEAKRAYLLAFEKAQAEGDTESAQFYLEASFEPKHPANYDSNYQSTYIKCLDK